MRFFLKEKIIYDFLFLYTLLIVAQNVTQLVGHPDFFYEVLLQITDIRGGNVRKLCY